MAPWLFLGCQERPFGANLGIYRLIQRVFWSDGGGFTALLSCSWRLVACGDDSGRSLCRLSCLAVITADIEVLEFLFKINDCW